MGLTYHGIIMLVVLTGDGWTTLTTTTIARPLTCGEMLSDEIILSSHNDDHSWWRNWYKVIK